MLNTIVDSDGWLQPTGATVPLSGPTLLERDTRIATLNFTSASLIAMEFEIISDDSAVVFDTVFDAGDDASFVPPTATSPTGTFVGVDVISATKLRFNFNPAIADTGLLADEFFFQIEQPTGVLFSLLITPIVPEPVSASLLALGGLALCRRR
ncbi:MAG: hypothetical protein ACFCVE_12950 [Phycisphaerae bacterium]